MRRLTTATPASRLPLARLFEQQPIEELLELRSILAAQNLVAKIHENPIPRRLTENDAYLEWVKTKCRSKSSVKQMDKTAFDAFVKNVSVYLQQQEEQVFNEFGKIGPMEEEELTGHKAAEFVEAVKLKMARHMCMQTAMSFELLDKDKDGVRCSDVSRRQCGKRNGVQAYFRLYDYDAKVGDGRDFCDSNSCSTNASRRDEAHGTRVCCSQLPLALVTTLLP
uniref:Uncharacterized protein n=1 Tax=Hyaloperonospora arabidopsidis (strain Emoy2) TaxID=559515 RepID=M4BRM8_HYAAE